ncbi:hypothetical protein [Phenylobacterium sp.]|jgi:hypothetical protein|uniref:hypothetical protein n=1 Tax=Phenylobacterium sp. TaxID=1871053 RepID=UPI002E34B01F|nr:hypothetical protein [Phenylobacterium sp.]HEX4711900.1 hypothetical protein [Phenylobacterium sp.]
MSPPDEPASFDPQTPGEGRKKASSSAEQPAAKNLIAITVDADTGRVVKIESVDAAGERHELTEDVRASLAHKQVRATVEGVVEEAFEAGIDLVLGAPGEAEGPDADEEDADLRRVLLRSLIRHSPAKRLVQRDVLAQAIVGSLIEQEAKAEGAATH